MSELALGRIIWPVRWLALLVILGPLLGACSGFVAPPVPTSERAAEREPARTARAQRGDISGQVGLSGEIRPKGQQTLTAHVAGRVARVYVDLGSTVQEGQPVAELDRAGFELRVVQGEAALAAAEARLAGLQAGAHPDEAAQAEAVLRGARARLEALQKAPRGDSPEQLMANLQGARQHVAQLEAASSQTVVQADAAVSAARARVDQLQRDPNAAQNQAALSDAQRALRQAEDTAAQARRGGSADELSRARQDLNNAQDQLILSRNSVSQADLDQAQAMVQAAEIALKRAGAPPAEAEVKAAQAEAQRTQAELEVARVEAREATVLATFSGLVSEVFVVQGTLVGPGSPLLTVMPPSFEVVVPLPEAQVGQVAVGQPVKLGVDAYPARSLPARSRRSPRPSTPAPAASRCGSSWPIRASSSKPACSRSWPSPRRPSRARCWSRRRRWSAGLARAWCTRSSTGAPAASRSRPARPMAATSRSWRGCRRARKL
jgi:multidrug resistance efflux pump